MSSKFYGNGKLLLTSEYLVLDGAQALAVPTSYGQSLVINSTEDHQLRWKSYNNEGDIWFEQEYWIKAEKIVPQKEKTSTEEKAVCETIQQLFAVLKEMNPQLLKDNGYSIETHLDFPRNWGLGSSSTLIYTLSEWAKINPYVLLEKTFGGSGYDIACASQNKPILFQLNPPQQPTVLPVDFNPDYKDELFFVHLNRKQNSRKAIQHYRQQNLTQRKNWVAKVSAITENVLKASTIQQFEDLLEQHEQLLSSILNMPTVKKKLFSDYPRAIKSLGGWGGDFIMVAGSETDMDYFRNKNYSTIIGYQQMLLH